MGYLESAGYNTRFDTNLKDKMKGFCKPLKSQNRVVKVILFPRTGLEKNGLKLSLLQFKSHFRPSVPVLWKLAKICTNMYFENPT